MTKHALGRLVHHDPRSLNFLVAETDTPISKSWPHRIPILDQGSVGSCTGNASVNVLGTGPFYGALYAKRKAGLTLDEAEALKVYSKATTLDPFDGSYPPDDTGSSGLAAAQALQSFGLIKAYSHITSLAAAHNAIQTGPFIIGSNWYEGFDNPDSGGHVYISGQVRGGHEYAALSYNATYKRWRLVNSWGPNWGRYGYFYFYDDTFARLLSEQGDATVFTL
jgi:hypothetical protein